MSKIDSYNKRLLDAIIQGKDTSCVTSQKFVQSMKTESQIQQECIEWFRYAYPRIWEDGMLFHVANEGIRLGRQGARLKREGLVKGVADLCLSIPRKGFGALYIEMKKPGGSASVYQKTWGNNALKYGNKYVICYSREQFEGIVKSYLGDE